MFPGRRSAAEAGLRTSGAEPGRTPSRRRSAVIVALVLGIAGTLAAASYLVRPDTARTFALLYGSVMLNDDTDPVAVDLASGRPTVQLAHASNAVSAAKSTSLDVVPLADNRTLMLNSDTGEFNMVDSSGYVIKTEGGGVRLPDPRRATAVAAGPDAYILESDPARARADVYLVSPNTVASAVNAGGTAQARASARLSAPVAVLDSAAATANGDLWVLTDPSAGGGDGGTGPKPYQLLALGVRRGSDAGATLVRHRRVTLLADNGAAAVESAASGRSRVVAVATAGSITVFDGHRRTRIPVAPPGRVEKILAVTGLRGRVAFLYGADAGWSVVSAPLPDPSRASVTELKTVPATADLIAPAAGAGSLYTMDQATGALWQLDPAGAEPVRGAAAYPRRDAESPQFLNAQVVVERGRVIFNVRALSQAEVIFADGGRPPLEIDKDSGVRIDPSGSAALIEALAHQRHPHPEASKRPAPSTPRLPTQTVTDKIDCKRTSQLPHVPRLYLAERGSRSVRLHWDYQRLAPSDCVPSTYVVSAQLVSQDAPAPPSTVRVQGSDDLLLAGLFPDTTYRITVTAWLNGRGTSSTPLDVTTSPEGPAAPAQVRTTVDDSGNWTISWSSCGGVEDGCVPAVSWQIVPRLCDGRGLGDSPAAVTVLGDPTQHSFTYTYAGGAELLGRGLSFSVEGIGAQQSIGAPSEDGTCSYSWATPVASDITVRASAPADTTSGSAATATTVAVSFAAGAVRDLGGVDGELTYRLVSDGTTVAAVGPTTRTTVSLGDITAGRRYQVVVTVAPPRHPEAAVTLPAVPVAPAIASWPVPAIDATIDTTGSYTTATLSLTVGMPADSDSRGETFDFTDASGLVCDNSFLPLPASDVAPGESRRYTVDRVTYRGTCHVRVQLVQHAATATDPPLYGAGPSAPVTSAALSIDPPALDPQQDSFTAHWSSSDPAAPEISVGYAGSDPLIAQATSDWSTVVTNGTTDSCGDASGPPPTTIGISTDCVRQGGPFRVLISFRYFGQPETARADVSDQNAPQPVDPSQISFELAHWLGSNVLIHYDGPYGQHQLDELNWKITVTSDQSGTPCQVDQVTPSAVGDTEITVDLSSCAPPPPDTGTPSSDPGTDPPSSDPSSDPTTGPSPDPSPDPIPATYSITIGLSDPIYGTTHTFGPSSIDGAPAP